MLNLNRSSQVKGLNVVILAGCCVTFDLTEEKRDFKKKEEKEEQRPLATWTYYNWNIIIIIIHILGTKTLS